MKNKKYKKSDVKTFRIYSKVNFTMGLTENVFVFIFGKVIFFKNYRYKNIKILFPPIWSITDNKILDHSFRLVLQILDKALR